jgi:hypothetical protein
MSRSHPKVALLWRGTREERRNATPENNRLNKVFAALAAAGIEAQPAVYADDLIEEVRAQLLAADGVLVWVDPLSSGRTRALLDPLLREIATQGVFVSTHPDVILKMGTKEVLYRTKTLGWGTDTDLYRDIHDFRARFPVRLRHEGTRVTKQNRGNGGQGVFKVELVSGTAPERVRVLEGARGSMPEEIALETFLTRCEAYFDNGGMIVDQPFQLRLPEGMIRCYMGGDKVVGYGHQLIKALIPPPPEGPHSPEAQPGPRIMHPATAPAFQSLRKRMEEEWTPQMTKLLGIARLSLPVIWDADFLYGPRDAAGDDTYVLCEINVSAVFPIPDDAPEAIARIMMERLQKG